MFVVLSGHDSSGVPNVTPTKRACLKQLPRIKISQVGSKIFNYLAARIRLDSRTKRRANKMEARMY